MVDLYSAAVREQLGGGVLTGDTVGQPRPKAPAPPPQAQGMVLPPGGAPAPGGVPAPGGAPAPPDASAPEGAPAAGGPAPPDLAKWTLGSDPWAVMNLIAGDARTRTEVQQRLANFMRMPTGQSMPQHIRAAIRAMGFQVPDQVNAADGQAEAALPPPGAGTAPPAGPGAPLAPGAAAPGPVRETMGLVPNPGLPTARPPDEGQWVSVEHAGVPLYLFISPGGTVLKGPAALIGANIKHLQPLAGERHMTFHPTGHIPPLAEAQHTYAEHAADALPQRLKRQDSQLALVQALHDVAAQARAAQDGQAKSQDAAYAAQVQRQAAAALPGKDEPPTSFSSSPLPLSGQSQRGADNPMAGADTHASPLHDADALAASGTAAFSADGSGHQPETPPSTDLVPKGAGRTEGAVPASQEAPSSAGAPDQADLVPPTHKMHAWLMDHVMAHQPQMEALGVPSQPNELARLLEESGTPPEQVLALAHYMHLWHPEGGPPAQKAQTLSAIIAQALERAGRAGAISPAEGAPYQGAMDQVQDFVGHHGRFPSHRELAAHLYGRRKAAAPASPEQASGEITAQGASHGERPQAPGY